MERRNQLISVRLRAPARRTMNDGLRNAVSESKWFAWIVLGLAGRLAHAVIGMVSCLGPSRISFVCSVHRVWTSICACRLSLALLIERLHRHRVNPANGVGLLEQRASGLLHFGLRGAIDQEHGVRAQLGTAAPRPSIWMIPALVTHHAGAVGMMHALLESDRKGAQRIFGQPELAQASGG